MKKLICIVILIIIGAVMVFIATKNGLFISNESLEKKIYENITKSNQEAKNRIQNTTNVDRQEIENEVNQIEKNLINLSRNQL